MFRTAEPLTSNGASRGLVPNDPKPFPQADKEPISKTASQSQSIVRPRPKSRLIPRKDEDPFVSSPSASPADSRNSSARKPRKPPQYREGPFRNALVGQVSWPPARRGHRRAPDRSVEPNNSSSSKILPPGAPHVLGSSFKGPPQHPSVIPSPKRAPSAQHTVVNAKASSSKDQLPDRKSTRLNSSHSGESRMPSSA